MKQVQGRAIGSLGNLMQSYDREVGVHIPSGKHSETSRHLDLVKIVKELLVHNPHIFNKDTTSHHKSFTSLKKNIIKQLNERKVKEWVMERLTTSL